MVTSNCIELKVNKDNFRCNSFLSYGLSGYYFVNVSWEEKFHFLKSKKNHGLVSAVEVELNGTETLLQFGAVQEIHNMLLTFLANCFIFLPSSISFSPLFFPIFTIHWTYSSSSHSIQLCFYFTWEMDWDVSHWADDGFFNTLVFPISDK